MNYYTAYTSPVGELTIVSNEKSVVGLWIQGQKYFESTIHSIEMQEKEVPILKDTKQWLDSYFRGEKPSIQDISLEPKGSDFRQMVWKLLCEIPYGELTTYRDIAKQVAKLQHKKTMSAQAIGGAVGHNPISIIIPCHRVVGADGSLTGYAGGLDVKRKLLALENSLHKLVKDKEI